jgi:hypothetical protein
MTTDPSETEQRKARAMPPRLAASATQLASGSPERTSRQR